MLRSYSSEKDGDLFKLKNYLSKPKRCVEYKAQVRYNRSVIGDVKNDISSNSFV